MSDEQDKKDSRQPEEQLKPDPQGQETSAAAPDEAAAGEPVSEAAGPPAAAAPAQAANEPASKAANPVQAPAEAAGESSPPEAGSKPVPAAEALGGETPAPSRAADPEREAKLKAAAEARAARAAAKISAVASDPSSGAGEPAPDAGGAVNPEREAKLKAAEEARAARAAAKAAEGAAAPEEPKPPSPKQPQLDEALQLIQTLVSEAAVEESYINEMNGHMPTFIIKNEHWTEVAKLFRSHPVLDSDFLRNVSGVDYETYLEVVYHLISISTKKEYAVKIKADRENPQVASAAPVWATANWNEREIYDLLGIDFTGHPDLRRIMMPDDWVGHPLRKDYEPLDPEV
ncbi:NADH-quinone oxidoreductase subunit C [Paenibacillus solisilvae]|uniref:NADH-quinone oxidoreductase subunit C n=1 Tax=Paenibacillus solisilvae TaxID=2486751 RepID=A0ABW0VU70_9BACL